VGRTIDLSCWSETFETESESYSSFETIPLYLLHTAISIQAGRSGKRLVLVDCTASDVVPRHYSSLLREGIYIATPNKKGFSGELQLFQKIVSQSRAKAFHEATVGAGLPVISTLKDLIDTGDKVTKIEGIFSGTLSYIFNVFGGSDVKFSEVVKEAKEKGYTEPDPRDDLNGMDVARKLTILARLVGMDVEGPPSSSIFPIESLIPKALESVSSGDEFMAGLPAHDNEFDEKRAAAKKSGSVLRYVGSIDIASGDIKVGLQRYSSLIALT
jgi:homoserine dehydrogenase